MFFDNKEYRYKTNKSDIQVDYIIVGGEYRGGLKEISGIIKTENILLHNTLPYYIRQKIKAECDSANIFCYDIGTNGTFRLLIKNQSLNGH